jgi:type IV secretion system protein VirB2
MYKGNNKALIAIGTALLVLLTAHPALASQTAGGGLPMDDWFTKIVASITGPFAYTVSVVGLVGTGATLIFGGDMNGFLRALIFLVLVLCFIVAAKNFLAGVTGQGAEITTAYEMATYSADWITDKAAAIRAALPGLVKGA